MDPQAYQMRSLLAREGFTFCDSGVSAQRQPAPVPESSKEDAQELHHLELEAVASSSCDHETQTADCVLRPDLSFWSSTGASHSSQDEFLVFRLPGPLCVVSCVQMAAYRACSGTPVPHPGAPVYPPRSVSFAVGHSVDCLTPLPGRHHFDPSDDWQSFTLRDAPVASYLKVVFHGSWQQQYVAWLDLSWFVAMRRVIVYGHELSSSAVVPYLREKQAACMPGPVIGSMRTEPAVGASCRHTAKHSSLRLFCGLSSQPPLLTAGSLQRTLS